MAMVRNDDCRKVSIDDKYLYYMISSILFRQGPFDYLVRRSLESGKEQLIRLPKGICIKEICGDVVILAKEQHLRSYRIEEDMSLTCFGQAKTAGLFRRLYEQIRKSIVCRFAYRYSCQ